MAGGAAAAIGFVAVIALFIRDIGTPEPVHEPPSFVDDGGGAFQPKAGVAAVWTTVSDPDGYVNLRRTGSTNARVLARINVGQRVTTFPQTGAWWQVQLADGTIGYVARSRIELDGEAAPVVSAPPRPATALSEPDPLDMVIPDSSTRRMTASEIAEFGPETLRLARNEIYARKGRRFRDAELARHFGQFDWYRPVADEVTLNPVEQANVALLREAERRYGL